MSRGSKVLNPEGKECSSISEKPGAEKTKLKKSSVQKSGDKKKAQTVQKGKLPESAGIARDGGLRRTCREGGPLDRQGGRKGGTG